MARRHTASLKLILSVIFLASCGGGGGGDENLAEQTEAVDEAYKTVAAKRKVMDTPAARVEITKEFLNEYPSSKHTAGAVDAIYWYQGTELSDKKGALNYTEALRGRISDPEIAKEVDKLLIGYYGDAGMTTKMIEVVERLAAAGAIDFDDHWSVINGAVNAEDWKLARDYCDKARELATAEAFRAEYPNRDLSDGEVAEAVGHRAGMLLVADGWARANQGQLTEALADFAEADKLIPRYYFDIPEYDLYVYWGRTLMMLGDFEAAIERFAFNGLVMQNEEAMAGLKQAYARKNGDGSGFEEYAAELHRKVARTIDDFEMNDYAGTRHRFSKLQSEVTLLTFWFPT
jgi:tetratricopeptide (TPR) repeat protein